MKNHENLDSSTTDSSQHDDQQTNSQRQIHATKQRELNLQYRELTLNMKEELVERITKQQDRIEQQQEQIKELIQEMEKCKNKLNETEQQLLILQEENCEKVQSLKDENSAQETPKPQTNKNPVIYVEPNGGNEDELFESSMELEDDVRKDPDWGKTPLAKWLKRQRVGASKRSDASKKELFVDDDRGVPIKRGSGGGCACTKTCSKRCGCKKFNTICSSNCKCSIEMCENRNKNDLEDSSSNDENDPNFNENHPENEPFRMPSNNISVPFKMKR